MNENITYVMSILTVWDCPVSLWQPTLSPGACPTNDISIVFKIWPKFAVLLFKIYSTDHNEILNILTV